MLRRIYSIPGRLWLIISLLALLSTGATVARALGVLDPNLYRLVIKPICVVAIALFCYRLIGVAIRRSRNQSDKLFTIGSLLSIWFVLYFLSGLAVTYTKNALAVDFWVVLQNALSLGATAVGIEYIRYLLVVSCRRKNYIWFGIVISLVLALLQINLLGLIRAADTLEFIKIFTADTVPILAASLLLTYLAITVGFTGQLIYSLGSLAITILPPIIPKYDWYMIGVSSLLLVVVIYIAIDRYRLSQETGMRLRHHRPRFAFDVAFGLMMVALALFMTGVFSYKPIVVMSNSMVPVFARGSAVVVQRVTNTMDIKVGDIIQYQAENKMVTHRVVDIKTSNEGGDGRIYITKGDNSPSLDMPVKSQQIVGIIRSAIPLVGYPTVWLREASSRGH